MRWQIGRRSRNIEDRSGVHPVAAGGGGMLVLALAVWLLGGDPSQLISQGASQLLEQRSALSPEETEQQKDFVAAILGSTEDVWGQVLQTEGIAYQAPTLVLFSGVVDSACGTGQSAMGPFYCPLDRQAYLDLGFFRDLSEDHGAPGDFARAYVIAHEIGHYVQTLLGVTKDRDARPDAGENSFSVRMELQADCFAGLWGHYAQTQYNMLEPGDLESALNAATRIGDDRLQEEGQGYVVPDSFTHGTSAQRMRWFKTGFESGRIDACDTFKARSL